MDLTNDKVGGRPPYAHQEQAFAVQQKFRFGPTSQLRVNENEDSSRTWWILFNTKRKTSKKHLLGDIGSRRDLKVQRESNRLGTPIVESVLQALVSLGQRPSDYGTTRNKLETMRDAQDAAGIIMLLPVGRKIGRVKVSIASTRDLSEAAHLLSQSQLGTKLVLALSREPSSAKVLSVRLPEELYLKLQIEGTSNQLSPGQFLAQILAERYQDSL